MRRRLAPCTFFNIACNALQIISLYKCQAISRCPSRKVCVRGPIPIKPRAESGHDEQVAIGIGARMGNGLLLTLLAWLVVAGSGASTGRATVLACAVAVLFFLGFASLAARPQEAVIGYKG